MNPYDKKTQSIDTSSRVTQKITLVDTDTESTVINIFLYVQESKYEHVKERQGENKDPNCISGY